jgi:hypothetical protein
MEKNMRNATNNHARAGEGGAITIKALLGMIIVLVGGFLVIKITPVYIEQRQLTFKVDELANKISVRMPKQEEIERSMEKLRQEYELPAGSIALASFQQNSAKITLGYTRNIDLIFTTYEWKVDYTANGKAL